MAIPLTFKKPVKPAATAPVAEPLEKPDDRDARVAKVRAFRAEIQAFKAKHSAALSNLIATLDQGVVQPGPDAVAAERADLEARQAEWMLPDRPDVAHLASSLDQRLQTVVLASGAAITDAERNALAMLAYRINLVFSVGGGSGSAGA